MKKITVLSFLTLLWVTAWPQNNINIQWSRRFGNDGYNHRVVKCRGGYITCETTAASWSNPDVIIRKVNSNGHQIWRKDLSGSGFDEASSIKPTSDGGFIVVGITDSRDGDFADNPPASVFFNWTWVAKLNPQGVVQWKRYYQFGVGRDIVETDDGGYVVVGEDYAYDSDIHILKIRRNGKLQWERTLGEASLPDLAKSVTSTKGGFVVFGSGFSNIGGNTQQRQFNSDYILFSMDLNANFKWVRYYGGSSDDVAGAMRPSDDGGFVMTGWTRSSDGDVGGNPIQFGEEDFWTVKVDSMGDILWKDRFGGSGSDVSLSLTITDDGGPLIYGVTDSSDSLIASKGQGDMLLVKYSDTGSVQWLKTIGGSGNDGTISSVENASRGCYMLFGLSGSTDYDFSQTGSILMKLKETSTLSPRMSVGEFDLTPYPNPCDSRFSLRVGSESTVQVFDLNGRTVLPDILNAYGTVEVQTSELRNGVYLLRVSSVGKTETKMIVVSH